MLKPLWPVVKKTSSKVSLALPSACRQSCFSRKMPFWLLIVLPSPPTCPAQLMEVYLIQDGKADTSYGSPLFFQPPNGECPASASTPSDVTPFPEKEVYFFPLKVSPCQSVPLTPSLLTFSRSSLHQVKVSTSPGIADMVLPGTLLQSLHSPTHCNPLSIPNTFKTLFCQGHW